MKPHPALPDTARVESGGVLSIGGCRIDRLAECFGTPVYVYDGATIRARLAESAGALGQQGTVHYAAKAYLARWLLPLLQEYGIGLDVCSGVEMRIALDAGFPAGKIRLHGNNKGIATLQHAVQAEIGAIVVDSIPELESLIEAASSTKQCARVLLRLNPGIAAHTHRFLQTGVLDSKFGIPIATGDAMNAVEIALRHSQHVALLGYHAHLGTQILDLAPYQLLVQTLIRFATGVEQRYAFWPSHISPGGGIGIAYTDESPPSLGRWLLSLHQELAAVAGARPLPQLDVEPGRAIIGSAGVAIYTVGSIKRVENVRIFINVDGGMADNIRPALYEAQYAVLAATRMNEPALQKVRVAGPFCESGDMLTQDVLLPNLAAGDLLALPAAGAYCLPMSSNYNGALRPAVILVQDGSAREVQRRQTPRDLLSLDI